MNWVEPTISVITITLGVFHILRPGRVLEIVENVYPFVRQKEEPVARNSAVRLFGVIWIFLGVYLLISS